VEEKGQRGFWKIALLKSCRSKMRAFVTAHPCFLFSPLPPSLGALPRYGDEKGAGMLREKIAAKLYGNRITADEVFVSDGAKCDIGRLQMMFGQNVVTAVQDPSYPVYVDTAVIMGQTGGIDEESRQFDGACVGGCINIVMIIVSYMWLRSFVVISARCYYNYLSVYVASSSSTSSRGGRGRRIAACLSASPPPSLTLLFSSPPLLLLSQASSTCPAPPPMTSSPT